MKCTKCESPLYYGNKYCNVCGEKIEKGAYEADYEKSVWGKIDKLNDWWDRFTLKKFIDNWVVKILVLLLVLLWGFLDAYTDLAKIKFLESETYAVEYNKGADEYYIRTSEAEVNLNLYIPRSAEKITITEFEGENAISTRDMLPEEYKENPVKVKNNNSVCVEIASVRNDKIGDTVKFYVTE